MQTHHSVYVYMKGRYQKRLEFMFDHKRRMNLCLSSYWLMGYHDTTSLKKELEAKAISSINATRPAGIIFRLAHGFPNQSPKHSILCKAGCLSLNSFEERREDNNLVWSSLSAWEIDRHIL